MMRRGIIKTPCLTRLAVLLTVAWTCVSVRADETSLVGKNVYPRTPFISVTKGSETIASGAELSFPVIVRRHAGDLVTVLVGKTKQEGQIQRQDVLTASEAIPVFADRFFKNPENLYAAFTLSVVWEDLEHVDQAIAVMNKALDIRPDPVLYNRRGNLWQRKLAFHKAIRDYDESLRRDSRSVPCLFHRGLAWSRLKNEDKAIADFDAVLRLAPLNTAALIARGSSWHAKGNDDRALSDYTMAIILNPDEPFAYQDRATFWYHKGENIKALADFTETLRLQQKRAQSATYTDRGLVWVKLGLYGLALSDFDQAVQCDLKNSIAYNNRGWIRATCPEKSYRNGKLAMADAKMACELAHWGSPHHLSTLGEASAELGDFTSAIHWQSRAEELQEHLKPGDAEFKAGTRERLACYKAGKPFREKRPTKRP
jgi:tetratricopeptide (TPR) repeat protein